MSETSDMVRKLFSEGDAKRDEGLTTPDNIIRYDNIPYGKDPKWQILDVYRPKEREGEKLPVIVSVHGGGWVYGDKEVYQFYCMELAKHGFAVVNFTYRLAPENKFPDSLEDTNSVFSWVLKHIEEYGFDSEHIFAVGDSAGAHNLALYSAICTNHDYAKEYSFTVPSGFAPNAIALNCGVYRIVLDDKKEEDMTQRLMADLLPGKGTPEELELIQVAEQVTKDYPPAFLMTSVGDFLREQTPIMAAKLAQYNVPFVYRFYGDSDNQLGHVFHCNINSEDARICNEEECFFFKEYC